MLIELARAPPCQYGNKSRKPAFLTQGRPAPGGAGSWRRTQRLQRLGATVPVSPSRPHRPPAMTPPPSYKGNKQSLPSKPCAVCGRPMSWRKKWARNWEQVKYCSDACRMAKPARPAA